MGAPRRWAARLLWAALRFAPVKRRAWVEAMLRELDFVEEEWDALFWSLGCTSAIFRECLREWGGWLWKQCARFLGMQPKEENKVNSKAKKTLGVLAGVGMALALGVGFFFLRHAIGDLLLSVGIPKTMWTHILTVIVPAELIVVIAAVVLWRKRLAPVAVGMLATGFVMAAHVAVIVASH